MKQKANKPNVLERAMYLVSPEWGQKKYIQRIGKNNEPKMAGGGYGKHGASRSLNSMIGWILNGGSAEEDIDRNGSILRQRSRDLYAGGGLARSGANVLTTNVVGWGIRPKPKIDGEILNMTDEECDEWERNTLREFNLWADSVMCDAERQMTFYDKQQLAYRSQLVSGDVFVIFGMKPNKRTPYETTIRLLEADRVSTPGSSGESDVQALENGGRIVDGVEIDREGAVVAYHVANKHPLGEGGFGMEWVRVKAEGDETGSPNILHVATMERPEQRRGVPFVSAQIEQIKQLDRYLNSELAANVVSAMLTAFITTDQNDGQMGVEDAVNEDEKVTDDDLKLELAPGAIYSLPPGKKVQEINPIRNNAAFESFVTTLETIIGASMGIPKEVLIRKYESNYTAARGALMDFWREVRVRRTVFNSRFNQPIYEQWLAEAVANGRVKAPGFFDNPLVRQAWCGCMWMGSSMGHVDPLKEVKAATERIANNITTQEQEAAEYNGNDWFANIRQRRREWAVYAEMKDKTSIRQQEEAAGEGYGQADDGLEDEEDSG